MKADHKAALDQAKLWIAYNAGEDNRAVNLAAAYLELRELAKSVARDPSATRCNGIQQLRAAIGEE